MIEKQILTRVLAVDLQPRLLSYFRRRCGNEADAWDAAQEVMVRILEVLSRRSFERIGQLESYTWITAHNLRTDRLRRRRPHVSVSSLDEQGRPLVSRDMGPAQRTLLRA